MEKTLTLIDIQYYLKEIRQLEESGLTAHRNGPSRRVLQNIFRYSSALNIIKTNPAGTIFQLVN